MDKLTKRVDTFVFEIEQKGALWIEVKNGSQTFSVTSRRFQGHSVYYSLFVVM